MTWKGQPLSFYTGLYDRGSAKAPLTTSLRYRLCEMALFVLGISEEKLLDQFSADERAQMLATYETKKEIEWVQVEYPLVMPNPGKG